MLRVRAAAFVAVALVIALSSVAPVAAARGRSSPGRWLAPVSPAAQRAWRLPARWSTPRRFAVLSVPRAGAPAPAPARAGDLPRAGQLPRTGAATWLIALAGTALLLLGSGTRVLSRGAEPAG